MLQKQVLELRDEEGLSFAEIGEELDISKSQAYQIYKKATEEKTFINDDKNVQKRLQKPFINSMDIPQTADNMESIIELRQLEMEHEINLLDRQFENDKEKRELKNELKEVKDELEGEQYENENIKENYEQLSVELEKLIEANRELKDENTELRNSNNNEDEEIETDEDETEPELDQEIKIDILELFKNVKKYVYNKNNISIFLNNIKNIQIDIENEHPNIDPAEFFDEFNIVIRLKEYLEQKKEHIVIWNIEQFKDLSEYLQDKITNYIENN